MSVSLNRRGNPPRFKSIGQVIGYHDGFGAADVHLADIDGDRRADYCLTRRNGDVDCSRNGGQGDNPIWQGFSTEASVCGSVFKRQRGSNKGIFLEDINGNFRSDSMYVSPIRQV